MTERFENELSLRTKFTIYSLLCHYKNKILIKTSRRLRVIKLTETAVCVDSFIFDSLVGLAVHFAVNGSVVIGFGHEEKVF